MLSIIIPTKNEEAHLSNLLACLKKQQVKLEIIVADAGSTDKTRIIAKKAGCKVVKGGLPSVGRNNGVKHATYEQILFLDADVTFPNHFLKNCLEEMKAKNLKSASVFTSVHSNHVGDKLLFGLWNLWVWAVQHLFPHAAGYCIFSTKTIHKKIQGFDPTISIGEDANYVFKASKVSRFGILSQTITTSNRRLVTEGRLGMLKKMIHCGLIRMTGHEATQQTIPYSYDNHKT